MAASSSSDSRFVMGYPSMNNNNKYSPAPAPAPGGYALPMPQPGVYPPPPQQSPYYGYPGNKVESKKYASPSFNVWYDSRNYGAAGWSTTPEEDSRKRFGRIMLVTMVALIISMFMVSLVIWFLFGTEIPEFNVGSLSVSNFNVTDSMVTANWDVNVTVFNPNTELKVNFSHVTASIFYKSYPLAISAIEPFYLQGTHLHNFQIKLDNEKVIGKPYLADEINEGISRGMLFIGVRMRLAARFESQSVWRKETLRVFCEDLKVIFAPTGGSGILAEDSLSECLVFT